MDFVKTKLRSGNMLYPAQVAKKGDRLFFKFGFNRGIMNDLKRLSGAKWHGFDEPPLKCWSILDDFHNQFQLAWHRGENPYERYDVPLAKFEAKRPLFNHQFEMASHMLTRKQAIIACEMGTGKTLAAIEAMERSGVQNWWWIGTKSAIKSVQLEFRKWESRVMPRLFTYDSLKKEIQNWDGGAAPEGVIFDESARIKNATAQRSQAAMHLANSVRAEHGDDGYIILMSGSPAPKAPTDWWNQAETAQPGFLVEGDLGKLRKRLCLIDLVESMHGSVYPKLVTWWDDATKCKECGQAQEHEDHMMMDCTYVPSVNEIEILYERLKGLVLVKFKKDCLDLPDKNYRIIQLEPSKQILRVAQTLANNATSTIKALIALRSLSDGFQYGKKVIGTETCELCSGKKTIMVPKEAVADNETVVMVEDMCPNCSGTGEQNVIERSTDYVNCPKDDALIELMEEHDEGRMVICAGFTGSIDRICNLYKDNKWWVIRIDGKGWKVFDPEGEIIDCIDEALFAMDRGHKDYEELRRKYPLLCVIMHPASGSEGLTLTASPTIVYYSNDFNSMYRIQSEDRIHRPGMDKNKGATIIDLFHLPTDEYVKNNLDRKTRLQSISLGAIKDVLNADEINRG